VLDYVELNKKGNEMKNANQPAMPTIYADMAQNGQREIYCAEIGLTKREHFAAMAMQGILANSNYSAPRKAKLSGMANDAVAAADWLLAELLK
jgi:hypothetical protein